MLVQCTLMPICNTTIIVPIAICFTEMFNLMASVEQTSTIIKLTFCSMDPISSPLIGQFQRQVQDLIPISWPLIGWHKICDTHLLRCGLVARWRHYTRGYWGLHGKILHSGRTVSNICDYNNCQAIVWIKNLYLQANEKIKSMRGEAIICSIPARCPGWLMTLQHMLHHWLRLSWLQIGNHLVFLWFLWCVQCNCSSEHDCDHPVADSSSNMLTPSPRTTTGAG